MMSAVATCAVKYIMNKHMNEQENRSDATSYLTWDRNTLSQRLRKAGLKATRPRLLVLKLLCELGGHRSVDEIVQELHVRATPLPRASVYNVIEIFMRKGLVMLADAGPGPALYEICNAWHHHFICLKCGKVMDVPCVKGEKPCLLPDRIPGIVEETQIIFRGYCLQCLPKEEQRANGEGRLS